MGRPKTHGMSKTPLYNAWQGMYRRCLYRYTSQSAAYQQKGIKVAEEWKSFQNFQRDMGPSFNVGLTLERMNGLNNYSKENCVWATQKQQQRNRSNNSIIYYKGTRYCFSELAEKFSLNYNILWQRLNDNWSLEKALKTPIRPKKRNKPIKNQII